MHDFDFMIAIAGIIFGNLAFIVLILVWWRTRQRRLELQAEIQSKLIERFGSTPDLVTFLQSPAGREFVNGVQSGGVALTRERIVSGVRRAIVLSFLGLAFFGMAVVASEKWLATPGVIFLALGLGYLVATFASISLSKRLSAGDQ